MEAGSRPAGGGPEPAAGKEYVQKRSVPVQKASCRNVLETVSAAAKRMFAERWTSLSHGTVNWSLFTSALLQQFEGAAGCGKVWKMTLDDTVFRTRNGPDRKPIASAGILRSGGG